jgi:hypothetical protein
MSAFDTLPRAMMGNDAVYRVVEVAKSLHEDSVSARRLEGSVGMGRHGELQVALCLGVLADAVLDLRARVAELEAALSEAKK